MSGELTNEDYARMTLAETCSNCGSRVTTGGEVTPLRCPMCGSKLHGEEAAWHRKAKYGCPECGRGLGPRGETLHFRGCSKAGPLVPTQAGGTDKVRPDSRAPALPDDAEPRCPAHETEPLFECIECSEKRVGVRLP